jgi:hypothetical protein
MRKRKQDPDIALEVSYRGTQAGEQVAKYLRKTRRYAQPGPGREAAARHLHDVFERHALLTKQLRELLGNSGVITSDNPKYRCFALAFDKLNRQHPKGDIPAFEINYLIAKWVKHRCNQPLLVRIIRELFKYEGELGIKEDEPSA